MNEGLRRRGFRRCLWLLLATFAVLLLGVSANSDERILLIPRLKNGDTFHYESHARLNRLITSQSSVKTMFDPVPLKVDFSTGLLLSVQDFHFLDKRPLMAAQTQLVPADLSQTESPTPHPLKVDFTVGGDGSLLSANGLDDLDPTQRMAWEFWLAQFAFGWTLPASGVKAGEKWKTVEVEKTPSPISGLVWERETTYVQDEQCPILTGEQCAVFLTNATLKQKSNPENTTPEDYQLHHLKTSGTAQGTNETVLYISRKTGLLLRATEDVQQSLDVTVAKADNSNQVQYKMDVVSRFETVLVPPGTASTH
jgi:hypothetical protein